MEFFHHALCTAHYAPLLIFLPAGFVTGIIAALFGVGGGVIYVPLVFAVLRAQGMPVDTAMKVAVGTSLFTMLFTTISAGVGHYRRRHYVAGAAAPIVMMSVLASFAGAHLGLTLHGEILKRIFAAILIPVALRMVLKNESKGDDPPVHNIALFALVGVGAGLISSLVGVGGGVVLVPALSLLMRQPLLHTIGTSSIAIIFTAAAGAATYLLKANPDAGPHTLGYVNLLYAAAMIPTSMLGAWTGVRVGTRISMRLLKPLFALFLLAVALDMLVNK